MQNIDSDLIRGNIDTIILKTMLDGDKYGLDIIKEVEERSNGTYELKQPTLYSCLKRLENQQLITSYWLNSDIGGKRHYYKLTEKGREFYNKKQEEWAKSKFVIDNLLNNYNADEYRLVKKDEYDSLVSNSQNSNNFVDQATTKNDVEDDFDESEDESNEYIESDEQFFENDQENDESLDADIDDEELTEDNNVEDNEESDDLEESNDETNDVLEEDVNDENDSSFVYVESIKTYDNDDDDESEEVDESDDYRNAISDQTQNESNILKMLRNQDEEEINTYEGDKKSYTKQIKSIYDDVKYVQDDIVGLSDDLDNDSIDQKINDFEDSMKKLDEFENVANAKSVDETDDEFVDETETDDLNEETDNQSNDDFPNLFATDFDNEDEIDEEFNDDETEFMNDNADDGDDFENDIQNLNLSESDDQNFEFNSQSNTNSFFDSNETFDESFDDSEDLINNDSNEELDQNEINNEFDENDSEIYQEDENDDVNNEFESSNLEYSESENNNFDSNNKFNKDAYDSTFINIKKYPDDYNYGSIDDEVANDDQMLSNSDNISNNNFVKETNDLNYFNKNYISENYKQKLSNLSLYSKDGSSSKKIDELINAETNKVEDFDELKTNFEKEGIKVREHNKIYKVDTQNKNYLLANKINLAKNVILLGLYAVVLTILFVILNNSNRKSGIEDFSFKYFFFGMLPFICLTIYNLVIYFIDPYKKVPARYMSRIMMLISIIISVQLILITYCVNLQLGFYSFHQLGYNHQLWIVPTIVSVAPIISTLIYMSLFYSEKFNV